MVARDVEISGDNNQDHHPSTSDGAGTGSGEVEKVGARDERRVGFGDLRAPSRLRRSPHVSYVPPDRPPQERARLLKHAKKCGYARIKGIGGLTAVDVVMRSYSLTLGRPNKKAAVDVSLGETMSVSRKHGEIYYDFEKKGFFLKVLGKNGGY